MVENNQIVGSVVLVVMAIVSHILHDMAIAGDISLQALWKKISWLFPLSSSASPPFHSDQFFWGMAGMSAASFAIGMGARSNYAVTEWSFFFAWIFASIGLWRAFAPLIYGARMTWTILSSAGVAVLLINIYWAVCPTVTISPSRAIFGSISASTDVSESYTFRIQNRIDDDIYSTVFKLRVTSTSLGLNNFKLDIPKSSQRPLDENTAVGRQFGDISGVDCVDAKNQPVFLRVIGHLRPGDSREVTLSRVNPNADSIPPSGTPPPKLTLPHNDSGAVTVEATVSDFSHNSASIIRPGFQAKRFELDELLKCSAVSSVRLKE